MKRVELTTDEAVDLRRIVRKLVRAEIAASWKGGAHPADMPIIEDELRAARIRFSLFVTRHTYEKADK